MTLLLTRPSDPVQGPDRPWPNPSTPPQLAEPYPRPEPSNPTPFPPPRPNISLRIGRPPSLPRRHRVKRTVRWMWRHAGNVVVYWLAMTGAMVATVYGGVRLVVAVMPHAQAPLNFTEWTVAIVAVGSLVGGHLLAPRPKRPAHPWSTALRAAFHSRPWRFARRSGTPPTRARAA